MLKKNQDNHTDTKSAENEKCFAEENEEKLQSALTELQKEIHMTQNILGIGENNDLSSSFLKNAIISSIEQTNIITNYDSFIFSDEMLNANTTNDIAAPTKTPLDLKKDKRERSIRNEDSDENATKHPEEVDNENNDPTYQIDDDGEQHSDEENNDSSEEVF